VLIGVWSNTINRDQMQRTLNGERPFDEDTLGDELTENHGVPANDDDEGDAVPADRDPARKGVDPAARPALTAVDPTTPRRPGCPVRLAQDRGGGSPATADAAWNLMRLRRATTGPEMGEADDVAGTDRPHPVGRRDDRLPPRSRARGACVRDDQPGRCPEEVETALGPDDGPAGGHRLGGHPRDWGSGCGRDRDRDRQARGVHAGVGIRPHRVLPVVLDVGTDNLSLLNDAVDSGLRSLRKPVSAAYHPND
jgi:hypothetical protein